MDAVPLASERLDEIDQAVAVPLQERRPLRLAVVGEDDDLVRPRRVRARALDPAELLVELPQRLERVRALEPRVVRHLVVARERRVDGRPPAHHVRDHAEDDQVADDHAHRRPHERVDAAAMAAGPDVAPRAPDRRRPLEDHLVEEEDEHPGDVEPVREEGAVAGIRALLLGEPADGQDQMVGLAREQVAAAGAAVAQQPDARRAARLDLGAVVRPRARHRPPALLLDPAEGGDVLVRARAGSRPGSRRSARRGRSPTRSARSRRRRASAPSPARCRRASPAAARAAPARRSRGTRSPARR